MAVLAQLVDDVVVSTFEIDKAQTTIGRAPDNDIQINEITVSGHHAVVQLVPNPHLDGVMDYFIEDNGSTNGTFINDLPVEGKQRLNSNDVVRIAWNSFKFIDEDENSLEKTAYILQE